MSPATAGVRPAHGIDYVPLRGVSAVAYRIGSMLVTWARRHPPAAHPDRERQLLRRQQEVSRLRRELHHERVRLLGLPPML